MAGLRKYRAVGLAPQKYPAPVQRQPARAVVAEAAQAEADCLEITTLS